MPEAERRLTAIMFTDIVGYTAMAQADESKALAMLREHAKLVRKVLSKHGGREVKRTGDGFLVEFPSAMAATECAVDLEQSTAKGGEEGAAAIRVRIGIHVGDVVHEGGDVFGDAVNIASRIEPLAEGGGICVSQQVYDQVRNKVPFRFLTLGSPNLKNVSTPVEVYRLEPGVPSDSAKASAVLPRLAVLPFTNMSPDPSDEYFSDGLTEELISTLARIDGLEVISRTSVMHYKKDPKPVAHIFRELGSETVLEGSVRRSDNRLRIAVQMIDARRDRHLWAETYDRELKEIFEIQTDIARQVADALKVRIRPEVSEAIQEGPTADTEAYTLYLKGRYHWGRRELNEIETATTFFRKAIEKDPNFALGYVGLADCLQVLTTRFAMNVARNRDEAKRMLDKALELDPELAEALATRGVTRLFEFDLGAAESDLSRATLLKPSYASAHQWYSQLLIAEQRWDEALTHISKAAELDPMSQIICLVHTFLFEAKRDYATGLKLSRRAADLNPGDPSAHFELAWLLGKVGMLAEAKRDAQKGIELSKASYPFADVGADAMIACVEGDKAAVRNLLPKLKAHIGRTFTTVRFIADLHFFVGQIDEGFEWLERSWADREFDLIYLKSDDFLDGLRTDPRYLSLLRRLGLRLQPETAQTHSGQSLPPPH